MTIAGVATAPIHEEGGVIRSVVEPTCFMCGSAGSVIYENLSDRAFSAPGSWNVRACLNRKCGLWWLDPLPIQEDIWKAYASYYTHATPPNHESPDYPGFFRSAYRALMSRVRASYFDGKYGYRPKQQHWTDGLFRSLAVLLPHIAAWDISVMFLPFEPGGRLLELGCGAGDLLSRLSELGWRAEGADVDPQATENARMKGLDVQLGAVEDLAYPTSSFDAVIMVHVVEHVHDPRRFLQECYRILKPGGRLALVTPNAGSFLHRLFGRSWFPLEPPRHLHIFTVASIKTLLEEAGFEAVHPFTTIRDAGGLVAASRSIQRTGRFSLGSPQTLGMRVFGLALQVLEWLLNSIDRSLGEELTAVVRK